jgi:hypothetical protein
VAELITGQELRLTDLNRQGNTIIGYRLVDCQVFGPALVAPEGSSGFVACSFDADSAATIWEVTPGEWKGGVLRAVDCRFERCNFFGVGLALDADAAARMREHWAE